LVKRWPAQMAPGALGTAVIAGLLATGAMAAEKTLDLDFLAYLGSWQENDEEWLAVSEWDGDEADNEDLGLGTILGTAQTPQKETNDKEVKDDGKET